MDTTARSSPYGVDLNRSLSRTFTRQVAMQIDGTSFTSPTDSLAGYLDSDRFVAEIHPNDNMVAMGRTDLYYWMGKTALDCVKAVAPREEFSRILDFPSGYGRAFIRRDWLDEMRIAVGGLSHVNYIWRGYARLQDVVAWRRCST